MIVLNHYVKSVFIGWMQSFFGQVNVVKLFLQKEPYEFPFYFNTLNGHEILMQSLKEKAVILYGLKQIWMKVFKH